MLDLLRDALNEVTYDVQLAGVDFSLDTTNTRLYVGFGGYNDKLHLLVDTVFEKLRTFSIDPERLEVMTEKASRSG